DERVCGGTGGSRISNPPAIMDAGSEIQERGEVIHRAGADRGDASGDRGRGALYRESEELKSQWWRSCSSALEEGVGGGFGGGGSVM
ncbi:hypothetical protein PIB30_090629, partial [Stylosanthes scabra]|nr:hypothetical protein [Stylosanthes scabra]